MNLLSTKICTHCGCSKQATEEFFYVSRGLPYNPCKDCLKILKKEKAQKHKEMRKSLPINSLLCCKVCRKEKLVINFGVQSYICKVCEKEKRLNRSEDRKEKLKVKDQGYRNENKEIINKKIKIYRNANPHKVREQTLKKYNLTLEEYNKMFENQKGVCAICNKVENVKFNGKIKNLSVDHSYDTGKVRMLLCQICNQNLGRIEQDLKSGDFSRYLARSEFEKDFYHLMYFTPKDQIITASGNQKTSNDKWRLKAFNLTTESYNQMVEEQNNVCKICKKPEKDIYPNGKTKRLSIDHKHGVVPTQIRGLLCRNCNTYLAAIENTDFYKRALDYLEKTKNGNPIVLNKVITDKLLLKNKINIEKSSRNLLQEELIKCVIT